MTFPAMTEAHTASPSPGPRRVRPSAARLRDRVIAWMWIGLTTMGCFIAVLQYGVLGAVETAAGPPIVIALATAAHADQQGSDPALIDRIEWAQAANRPSLRVYPTAAARHASTHLASPDAAWAQVLKLAPEADRPGMREQFVCHWRFAEFAKPGKVSWNLEPWRPRADLIEMVAARCNPGGSEESY